MILKILEKRIETDQVFSLILEKPATLHFYPGQYLDVENTRSFTISSSPTEDFLMITTKTGFSTFKKALENLKTGDTIITSHPAGTFTLDESTPAVFIAGGIGITPFRSMIKYAVDQKIPTKITLIYSNSDSNFLFKKELNIWQKQLTDLTIHYIVTSQSGCLDQERLLKLNPKSYPLNPIYYLAGPPKMVDSFENLLTGLGIDEVNIRYDRFDGYIEY